MKKKKQAELIDKIIKSDRPNHHTKEFKKLQMHWYNLLEDKTDYNDIERTGSMRTKLYDEYGGNIKHYSWSITSNYDFSAHKHYQSLRKISWNAIVTSNSKAFSPSKPFKSLSLTDFEAFSHSNNSKSHSNHSSNSPYSNDLASKDSKDSKILPTGILPNTIKLQKLSKVDARILYLAGDGKHIREISKYLRRYLPHHASTSKTGPKGKPFSVFFVHSRLKKLIESIHDGSIIEETPQLKKFMKSHSTSTIKTPQDSEDSEGGGVRKSGLELNSYIYTENNND